MVYNKLNTIFTKEQPQQTYNLNKYCYFNIFIFFYFFVTFSFYNLNQKKNVFT